MRNIIFLLGIFLLFLAFFYYMNTGSLSGCVLVGSTSPSFYDGSFLHIPFSMSSVGYNCLAQDIQGVFFDKLTCEKIGWNYEPTSKPTCSPNPTLKKYNYTYTPNPLNNCYLRDNGGYDWRQYHPGNDNVSVEFDGSNVKLYSPTSGSVSCSGEVLVHIPETSQDEQYPITSWLDNFINQIFQFFNKILSFLKK